MNALSRSIFAALLGVAGLSALASTPDAMPGAGDVPPSALGRDLEGQPVSVGDYAGKVVVVTFWATWCPYCLKELPILERAEIALGSDKLQVIAVNTESRDVFRTAARALSAQHMRLAHDAGKEASIAYGVHGIPHMVIIGRSGRIVSVWRGYDESSLDRIVADINRALAEPH